MTLAPERTPSHGSTKPQGINPRLRVESDTPRPQRPAYKKSGRPNPAAHLTPEQIEGLGHELASLLHAGKGVRPMQLDLGVSRLGAGEFEVRHRARLVNE